MGKKKKGLKKLLFSQDYSDVTQEEQFQLLLLGERIMSGESVDIESEKLTKTISDFKDSTGDPIKDLVSYMKDTNMDVDEEGNLQELADKITEDSITLQMITEQNSKRHTSKEDDNALPVAQSSDKPVDTSQDVAENTDDDDDDDVVEPADDDYEDDEEDFTYDEEEIDMENATLNNQFKIIHADHDTGDIVIKDVWKDFKSHTISFFNMIEAKMDYTKSPLYEQMKSFIDLAVAFIAGPVLVIKHGNKKFKEFIDTVENFDRERILCLSKFDDERVDENGEPLIHFLIYYIDEASKDELETIFDVFEEPDSDNNAIILDFIYSVFKKAVDRHENQWGCYDGIDCLIDENESSDEDIDFVLELIKKDKDTVMGNGGFDHFMDTFVLPIEMFLSTRFGSSNAFNLYVTLLADVLDGSREDSVIEDGVIIVPNNFGYDENGTRVESFVRAQIEYAEVAGTNACNESEEEPVESDTIEDSDGEDIELAIPEEKPVVVPEKKQLGVQKPDGIKKFGSKPHDGGPLVITP